MPPLIEQIDALEILDSRGNPTLEVTVAAAGAAARAGVPSGASTGSREAVELRDNDPARYGGKGVKKAARSVADVIAPALRGLDPRDQRAIDRRLCELDGTPNKSRLGANALLGVSMATARLGAKLSGLPLYVYLGGADAHKLPVPCMNVLNGGVHTRWQGADFQEYMIAPWGAPTFTEAVRWGSEIYQALRKVLQERGLSVGVGDEGGFAPVVAGNGEPFDLLMESVEKAGYKPGDDVVFCADPASSEFFADGRYNLKTENRSLDAAEMIDYYEKLRAKYPLISLEDGLAENDWDGWRELTARLGGKMELVGDDLFVTNVEYIQRGIREKCANAALIKLNQIGTVSETFDAARLCLHNGWGAFISHRSAETPDSFIADLSVALAAGTLKTGAPCRGERVEKYNRLLRIEKALGGAAVYAGKDAFVVSGCR